MEKTNSEFEKYLNTIKHNPHILGHILGYKKLSQIHTEWIKYIYYPGQDRTLMAHRGSYKTTSISVVGVVWCLLFWPDTRILLATSTSKNVMKVSKEVRRCYKNPLLLSIYECLGYSDPRDLNRWTIESFSLKTNKKPQKEGNVECIAPGGEITGSHYDLILPDDIVTLKDRISPAVRESKKQWVKEIQSVVEPTGHIGYVGTCWHPEDIYSIVPPAKKYPLGSIEIIGLNHDRIQEIRRIQGESFFDAQYNLIHTSDVDKMFHAPNYTELPDNYSGQFQGYLDPNYEGDCETALVMGCYYEDKYYVVAAFSWNALLDETYQRVKTLYHEYKLSSLTIESNSGQKLICREYEKPEYKMSIRRKNHHENKHMRIQNFAKKEWDKLFWSQNVDNVFLQKVLDYTEFVTIKDPADALAGFIEIYSTAGVSRIVKLTGF